MLVSVIVGTHPVSATVCVGDCWQIVTSPNVGSGSNSLSGVTVVSSNEVWAVGGYTNASNLGQTLVQKYNGTSWSVVTNPNVGSEANNLAAVDAYVSGGNNSQTVGSYYVWAVGSYYSSSVARTLVEGWDGTSWTALTSQNSGSSSNQLRAVSASSATDVWSVGDYVDSGGPSRTLVEHSTDKGSTWSIVSSPNNSSNNTYLTGVSALSASDVWAVGYANVSGNIAPYTIHWNGSAWSVRNIPEYNIRLEATSFLDYQHGFIGGWNPTDNSAYLNNWDDFNHQWNNPYTSSNKRVYSVDYPATDSAWAAGIKTSPAGTLALHWDGTSWHDLHSLDTGNNPTLRGIAGVNLVRAWTVGYYTDPNTSKQRTLIELYTYN